MSSEWHYTQSRQPAASPISFIQLKLLADQGLLKPDDLVWKDGMPEWIPAGQMEELFPDEKKSDEVRLLDSSSSTNPGLSADWSLSKSDSVKVANIPEKVTLEGKPKESNPLIESPFLGISPVWVLLFSLATFGLFAAWYVWSYQSKIRSSFLHANKPLQKGITWRHPAFVLFSGTVTLGYYCSYWVSKVLADCSRLAGRTDLDPETELALMVVVPFYTHYHVLHTIPMLLNDVRKKAGLAEKPVSAPILYATPLILVTLPLICGLYQEEINAIG